MVTDILLSCILVYVVVIGVVILITVTVIDLIKDIKGDTLGEQVKLLKELGYEVEVENGTIFIILPEKLYYNKTIRKSIENIMNDYCKSYGIRLKDEENE